MKVANFSAPSKVCAVVLDEMTIKCTTQVGMKWKGTRISATTERQHSLRTMQLCSLSGGCTTRGNSQLGISYLFVYNEQVNNDRFRRTAYRQCVHWRFDRPSRAIGSS